jgi:hypothetical protein
VVTIKYQRIKMKVKILNVKNVKGKKYEDNWYSDMQDVETDQGLFIDNATYSKFKKGHDWEQEIGKYVEIKINHSNGHKWINYIKNASNNSDLVEGGNMKATIIEVIPRRGSYFGTRPSGMKWRYNMQEVVTDIGSFIENDVVNPSPSRHWKPVDYTELIDQEVEFTICDDNGERIPSEEYGLFSELVWIKLEEKWKVL